MDLVVDSHRDNTAVKSSDGEASTFGDISRHANSIALALQASRVGPGLPVAVLQEPTHEWISSIIGIMRLGAVYLPLD